MAGDGLHLPDGTVLVHIGPQKTGTTMLQGALSQARPEMRGHGVNYVGERRQHLAAANYVSGNDALFASRSEWELLVRQVSDSVARQTVVSSEGFANAADEAAAGVVKALGGSRVHVLVTLRPLAKILPSAWQQYVRNRQPCTYYTWLDATLNQPLDGQPTPTFWHRHTHEALVRRWASVVGPENLTVAVLDDSDRYAVLRAFEGLVNLPEGLLQPDARTNRSLTRGEIELVRQLNLAFHERGWSRKFHFDLIQNGAVRRIQTVHVPGSDEPRITTPRWALDRVADLGGRAATEIEASGVRIVGDLAVLGTVPENAAENENPAESATKAAGEGGPALVPPSVAAEAMLGTIRAGLARQRTATAAANRKAQAQRARAQRAEAREAKARQAGTRRRAPAKRGVEDYTAAELASILLLRGRRRLRRDLRRLRNR